jgi:putative lumazine-binding protein
MHGMQLARIRRLGVHIAIVGLAIASPKARAAAQASPADSAGIRRAALDYIEGWYSGDVDRMTRALHPELAKRIVRTDPKTGRSSLGQMSAMTLVNNVRMGGGKQTPEAQQRKDVRILDVFQNAAVARVDASTWVDYLQLAKWNGQWVIVNVLWELRPENP